LNTIRLVLVWLAIAATAALAQQPVVVVGAVISQTGAHAELAQEYARGLDLWRDEVNAAGGLLGRRVELRVLDDGSQALRAGPLYAYLIQEEKVDLLVGPYGSAATIVAAAETERARRVMVNGAGPAAAAHARGPRYLFQSALPYASYGMEVLQTAIDAGLQRLFVVARDDVASREAAEALRNAAAAQELTVNVIEVYKPGTVDYVVQVARARAAKADAWIAFGDVRDAAEMVKTFKRLDYAPKLFFAQGAAHPRFIALLGQDAEWSLGAADFDPRLGGLARQFAKAYAAKFDVPPGLAAAEGYAAGSVLAAGVLAAGTFAQESLRAALAEIETTTVLGEYRVAPESGVQIGARPRVVQIRLGRPQLGTPLLPYPQWDERALIQ
jgi:branched-chain amino acid transport system substrate-binding protein